MDKSYSEFVIKSIAEEAREIEGMATTPTVDRVNDVVDPMGLSFKREAALLLNHDHSQPVGTVTFGTPTANGLPFKAKIAKVSEPGEVKTRTDTAWHSVKSGIIKGVSIGFRPVESKALSNGGKLFTKADVHELSLVAVPCNPDAQITSFKSLNASKGNILNQTAINQVRKALDMSPWDAAIKSAVAPATTANTGASVDPGPGLSYVAQQNGVTVLQPLVTRSVIAQLADLGAPQLPPDVRALTQAGVLIAPEIPEGGQFPAAAPGTDFVLEAARKVGLIMVFNSELTINGSDAVLNYVQGNLESAADNGVDDLVTAELLTLAGTAHATIKDALTAFDGDIRTACWLGNPDTLTTLRSPQETGVGPNGGVYYQLPALPVLAMPEGVLLLVDAKRTAVWDGPQFIERSNEADIVMDDGKGTATTQIYRLFQQNGVALKVTKYFDYKAMVNPVALTV